MCRAPGPFPGRSRTPRGAHQGERSGGDANVPMSLAPPPQQPLSRAGSASLGAFAAAAVGRPCPCCTARSSPKRAEILYPESAALGICSRAGAESPDPQAPSRSLEWAPTEPRGGIGAARPASLLGTRRVRTPGSVQGFHPAPSALPAPPPVGRAEEPRVRPLVWPRPEGGEAGRSGSSGHQRSPSKDLQNDAAFYSTVANATS